MMILTVVVMVTAIIGMLLLLGGFRVIKQYQRGVKFTLGKYTGLAQPGLTWIFPAVQWIQKIDLRQVALNLKPQEVMTKDQVNLKIDGVIFYSVNRPEQVVLNVENLKQQLHEKATSELKDIVGSMTLSEALQSREKIAEKLQNQMTKAIKDLEAVPEQRLPWGIQVRGIQINNIELPQSLVRAMAKEAEAEREKNAIFIRAQGELAASKNYQLAAEHYQKKPMALRLRELKTYEEIGKEHNSLMIVIPSQMADSVAWTLPFGKGLLKENNKNEMPINKSIKLKR